jgi:hypothetical protein
LPPSGPPQTHWYVSRSMEDEEGIPSTNVETTRGIDLEREDEDPTRPCDVEVNPNDSEESPLSTLGQLKNSLPDIPGRGEDSQELSN